MQLQRCYICGDTLVPVPKGHNGPLLPKHRTSDHVPPKGIFNDPKPSNLITVPACHECNGKHSGFDEQLRTLAAMETGRNAGGEKILMQKVLGSTMANRRQAQFVAGLVETLRAELVRTPSGVKSVLVFSAPPSALFPGIIAIVKGLLASLAPEYDYHGDNFEVVDIHSATLAKGDASRQMLVMREMMTKTKGEARGNENEFQFWRRVEDEIGAWLLAFYGSVFFLVWHGKPALMERFGK